MKDRYAALDLGSNSFHLVIAQMLDGSIQTVDKNKHMVRLGEGLDDNNRLSGEAIARGIEALTQMGQLVADIPEDHFRAVATNTLRVAENRDAFLAAGEAALGKPIEIISGSEEAALIYLGISKHNHFTDRSLVIDIGGGSTEIILGEGSEPQILRSLTIGCANIAARCFPKGKINKAAIKKARDYAGTIIEPHITTYRSQPAWARVVLSSGTAKAIARVLKKDTIDRADLDALLDKLADIGHADKLPKKLGVDEARAYGFTGGVSILAALYQHLDLDRAIVSQEALREGVLLELMGRDNNETDERERTARAMQNRFAVDVAQADRVAALADHLNRQLPETAPPRFAPLLRYAAWLHETGWAVARNDMQKHGAYILEHADMPGYSRLMQNILAVLVKAQKRKLPDKDINALPEAHRAWVWQNALALRLAVLLCRARTPIAAIDYPDIRRFGDTYRLRFPDGYLAAHPLTHADLQQEQALWQENSPWVLEYNTPE